VFLDKFRLDLIITQIKGPAHTVTTSYNISNLKRQTSKWIFGLKTDRCYKAPYTVSSFPLFRTFYSTLR